MGYVAAPDRDPYQTTPGWGWAAMLLPHIEQPRSRYRANFDLPVERPDNLTTRDRPPWARSICPADRNPGPYVASAGRRHASGPLPHEQLRGLFSAPGSTSTTSPIGQRPLPAEPVVRFGDSSTAPPHDRRRRARACLVRTPWVGPPGGGISSFTPNSSDAVQDYPPAPSAAAPSSSSPRRRRRLQRPRHRPRRLLQPSPPRRRTSSSPTAPCPLVRRPISLDVLRALCTRAAGEIITSDAY